MCRCVFSYVIVIHLHNLYVVYITSTNVVWSRTLLFLSISIYVENERHHFKFHCIILYHSLPCLIWATRYLYVQQHMDCMGWIHTKYIHHHHFVCFFSLIHVKLSMMKIHKWKKGMWFGSIAIQLRGCWVSLSIFFGSFCYVIVNYRFDEPTNNETNKQPSWSFFSRAKKQKLYSM